MGEYDKDFQEGKSLLPDSKRLNDKSKKENVVQDNENKSDSSSFHLILLQIAQDNWHVVKKLTKNAKIFSDNKI